MCHAHTCPPSEALFADVLVPLFGLLVFTTPTSLPVPTNSPGHAHSLSSAPLDQHAVGYCSDAHRAKDATHHRHNCILLAHIAAAEAIHFDEEEQREALCLLNLDPTVRLAGI